MTAPRFVLRYRTWAEMLHDHLYELHGLKTRDVDPTGFHEADHMADIAEEDRPNGWDEHAVTEFYGGWFALDHPEAEPGAPP